MQDLIQSGYFSADTCEPHFCGKLTRLGICIIDLEVLLEMLEHISFQARHDALAQSERPLLSLQSYILLVIILLHQTVSTYHSNHIPAIFLCYSKYPLSKEAWLSSTVCPATSSNLDQRMSFRDGLEEDKRLILQHDILKLYGGTSSFTSPASVRMSLYRRQYAPADQGCIG